LFAAVLAAALLACNGGPDATGDPGPSVEPAALRRVAGDGQQAIVGHALAETLAVQLVSEAGSGLPNVDVQWTVVTGGGQIAPLSPRTDAAGMARAVWTLGARLDTVHVARASSSGVPSVDFVATPRPATEAIPPVADCTIPSLPAAGTFNQQTDVAYASPGGQAVKLDIAWPKSAGPHPLVVLFHGGGWSHGSKGLLRSEIQRLAGAGYAAASIGYRLTDVAVFPAQASDARCAVRWLRSHAGQYGIDPARVASLGYSAGAHLATLLATASEKTALDTGCPSSGSAAVDGAVSYAGPQDLRASTSLPQEVQAVTALLGGTPESRPQLAALASPMAHVTPDDPPLLLVHGTADATVPVWHARVMRDTMQLRGAAATLVELPGIGHDLYARGMLGTAAEMRPAACTTFAFLDQLLK
jgi:acetyl esterase/lipase